MKGLKLQWVSCDIQALTPSLSPSLPNPSHYSFPLLLGPAMSFFCAWPQHCPIWTSVSNLPTSFPRLDTTEKPKTLLSLWSPPQAVPTSPREGHNHL